MKDFYAILGATLDSTDTEIKQKYRRLARQYHPDVTGQLPDDQRRTAEELFKVISEAYAHLGDSAKRALYDEQWRSNQAGSFGLGRPKGYESYSTSAQDVTQGNLWVRVEYFRGQLPTDSLALVVSFKLSDAQRLGGVQLWAEGTVVGRCVVGDAGEPLFWFTDASEYHQALNYWRSMQPRR